MMIQLTGTMMIRRKFTTATALTVCSALLLTGCGRDDDNAPAAEAAELTSGSATGTITVWAQGTEGEALKEFIAPFEEANPDVTVEVTAVPWDSAQNKYQTAVAGGTTPDIGMLGSDWMPGFASAIAAVPDAIDTSGIFPFALASTEFDGVQRAVPWYVETRVIFYRTDLMEQAGFDEFPTDWDGLKELATAFKDKTGAEYGIALPSGGWNAFLSDLPFAWSNGADIMNEDQTEWTLDSPEMAESLSYLNSFFEDGLADKSPSTESGSASADLVSGSVPMFLSGPWDIPGLETSGGEGFEEKFDVATIPASPNGESTSFAAGANLAVFNDAENPDGAWKLIQWLNEAENQVEWFETVNDLPAQRASWDDPALTADPRVAVFGDQLESVRTAPTLTSWAQVSAAADTQIEQVFRGGKDVEQALGELQSTAESLGADQ